MKIIRQFLLNDKNISKNSYLWNTIAGLINAFQSVLILMVLSRTNSDSDAGIFSLGYSTACLLLTIGNYGMRSYQVTDLEKRFNFGDYLGSRIISSLIMVTASVGFCSYGYFAEGYSLDKAIIILLLCLLKLIDAIEDVYHGMYQSAKRLDVSAKCQGIRLMLTVTFFCLLLIITSNLLLTALLTFIISMVLFVAFLNATIVNFRKEVSVPSFRNVPKLMTNSFAVFFSAFLSMYIVNAPKYAIDIYQPQEVQAYYGYIAMPVFVVGLLNNFLYQPILVSLAQDWKDCRIKMFCKRVLKQHIIVIILTISTLIGGYVVGIPILSWMYNTNLSMLKNELMVLLVGGGFLALSGFIVVLITLIRKQKVLIFGYAFVAVFALLLSPSSVENYGITGASYMYTILMGLLYIMFEIILLTYIFIKVKGEKTKKTVV